MDNLTVFVICFLVLFVLICIFRLQYQLRVVKEEIRSLYSYAYQVDINRYMLKQLIEALADGEMDGKDASDD